MPGAELARTVGIGLSTLGLIRKAGRILDDPIPNYATPSDIHGWLRRWPQFQARDFEGSRWMERLAKYNAQDRRAQLVSRFGGL